MVYTDSFVANLDNYKQGFVKQVNMLIVTAILLAVFTWMLNSSLKESR
jgi:hypothetical protein